MNIFSACGNVSVLWKLVFSFCLQIRRLEGGGKYLANGIYNSGLDARCQAKCLISEALKKDAWDSRREGVILS